MLEVVGSRSAHAGRTTPMGDGLVMFEWVRKDGNVPAGSVPDHLEVKEVRFAEVKIREGGHTLKHGLGTWCSSR